MKFYSASIACLLVLSTCILAKDKESKVVTLRQGKVKGYKSEDGNYFEFFGIPYATAPKGEEKFKAPLPAPIWLDTMEAVHGNIICMQNTSTVPILFESIQPVDMKQDCLIANVFVPDVQEKNLPVVVIVHGGGYLIGFGNMIKPTNIVNGGFIVVDFNYRLGAHGFLCLGTEDAPGNAGLKDQLALLRWVKNNIERFGGNPDEVTLSGYSAGASSVHHLALSPATKGLFKRVIPESGTSTGVWGTQIDPIENALEHAKTVGFESNNLNDLEKFYKTLPDEKMYLRLGERTDSVFIFVPCVEKDLGQEMVVKEAPIDILKSGNFPKLPFLFGFANMEGLFHAEKFDVWSKKMNENFSEFLPADLIFPNAEERIGTAKKIKEFYFGDGLIDDNYSSKVNYVNYFSDVLFAYSTVVAARLQAKAGSDVYMYQFSFADEAFQFMSPFPEILGANHCAQSIHIYNNINTTEDSKKMSAILRQLWNNFMTADKPILEQTADLPDWPPFTADGSPYMELTLIPELNGAILPERVKLWDEVYAKYHRKPIPPADRLSQHTEL